MLEYYHDMMISNSEAGGSPAKTALPGVAETQYADQTVRRLLGKTTLIKYVI